MNMSKDSIKSMYFRYLSAAFGSAMISSIYGVVDMAMVGQYQGADGTAALAVVAPIWNIIYSLGLLMGIGGSVMFSTLRGISRQNQRRSNEYFTVALIGAGILSLICWIGCIFFDRELLMLFGADEILLPLAMRYMMPVKFVVPSFLMTQVLAAFLRNDGVPELATKAVLFGGIFNILADYVFVFVMRMGIMGAGLATALGSVLSLMLMLTHFRSKRNTLFLQKPEKLMSKLKSISVTGFSTFFVDVAMGILTVLFNRQIMKYFGTSALSVYGIMINVSTFVQCCAYSIGQASQPIISTNYGAKQGKRINETLKYALTTAAVFGIVWTLLVFAFPNQIVSTFMSPNEEILRIAPAIICTYGSSFLLLPLNIFSTYYFQAILKPLPAFLVSVGRGAIVSSMFILLLPMVAGVNSLWLAMPLTEMLVAVYVIFKLICYSRKLSTGNIYK